MHALRRILDDIRALVRASSMPHSHLRDRLGAALTLTFVVDIVASGRWPIDKLCSHDFGLDGVHDAILATAGRGIEGAIHVTVSAWKK